MRQFTICLASVFIVFTSLKAYAQTTFQKIYSVPANFNSGSYGMTSCLTKDNKYGIAGTFYRPPTGVESDFSLMKLDLAGNVIWGSMYGLTGKSERCYSMQQTTDSGFIMTGSSIFTGSSPLYIVKANSVGDLTWAKTYGTFQSNSNLNALQHPAIRQTTDGGYMAVGTSTSPTGMSFLKLDNAGNLTWAKQYTGTSSTRGGSFLQLSDQGYILAGADDAIGGTDICLLRTNSSGTIIWAKTYGNATIPDYPMRIRQTKDKGYIVFGVEGSQSSVPTNDMLIFKTDSSGNLLWNKVWGTSGGCEIGRDVIEDSDGNFVVTGTDCNGGNGGSFDLYLAKLNAKGDFIWQRKIDSGPNTEDDGFAITQATDGGYLLTGISFVPASAGQQVIKTDSAGLIDCNEFISNLPIVTSLIIEAAYFPVETVINPTVTDVRTTTVVTPISPSEKLLCTSVTNCPLTVSQGSAICLGTSKTLAASGATNYTWSPSAGLNVTSGSSVTATPTITTTYTVVGSTGSCTDTATIAVVVSPAAFAGIISALRDTICEGTPAILTVTGSSGPVQWQSSISSGNFNNISGATTSSYQSQLAQTTYFRIIAGSGNCSDSSSIFKLVVAPTPVASFSYSQTGLTVNFSSATVGTTIYKWDFGDNSPLNAEANPSHTYTQADSFHVCLTVFNASNCSYTICRDIEVVTGAPILSQQNNLRIYPNPFNDIINVELKQTNKHIERIEVYDLVGRVLLGRKTNGNNIQMDLSGLSEGIYYFRIIVEGANYIQSFVKQ